MQRLKGRRQVLSIAEKCGFAAFLLAIILAFFDPRLATLPLASFVLFCAAAPFSPRHSFFLSVISSGNTGRKAVALTFDDGPDPATTPGLLDLLARHKVPAAFFINGVKAEQTPDLVQQILTQNHEIGNHSHTHDNLLMFKSTTVLKEEIVTAQQVLKNFGIEPLAFRPPVGVTGPRLRGVLCQLGMYTLNFNCRAGDRGNRRIDHLQNRILTCVRPDAIIALHDVRPRNGNATDDWLGEVDRLLQGLRQRGYEILPLSELIDKPVMRRI